MILIENSVNDFKMGRGNFVTVLRRYSISILRLFNDALSITLVIWRRTRWDYCDWCVGNGVEGDGCNLFENIIPKFGWRNWGKPWNFPIRI